MLKKIMGSALLLLFISSGLWGATPKVGDIIKEIDVLQEINSDMTVKIKITQQVVDEGVKNIEAIMYRRDADDSFLMVMIAPDADKGNGYLKSGDNLWMYRRNTRSFQHINRDESIGGSDTRAGDVERRKTSELYAPATDSSGKEIISEEELGKVPVYKFKIKAVVNDVTYPEQILWVRQDNYLPLKTESYSLSGTLMVTQYFLKYTKIDGRYIPMKQIYIDEFEVGNKSIMEFSSISTKDLGTDIFTKGYLENLSK